MTLPGPGHNNGPTLEPGQSWRRTVWARARAELLPALPVEVVRLRVRRAQELGLPYRTYAGIRASNGHDLIGFLFSTNALGLLRTTRLSADRTACLISLVATERRALVQGALEVQDVASLPGIDAAAAAPRPFAGWAELRATVRAAAGGRPADRFLVIGETALEREWSEAARCAGFLSGERFFAAAGGP